MKRKWLILALVLASASLLAVLGSGSVLKSVSAIPSEKVPQGPPEPGPGLLATVDVSGSTNSSPYSIRILTDGSATMSIKGESTKNFSGAVLLEVNYLQGNDVVTVFLATYRQVERFSC